MAGRDEAPLITVPRLPRIPPTGINQAECRSEGYWPENPISGIESPR